MIRLFVWWWLGIALALAAPEPVVEREDWAILLMQGQPAGYHHVITKRIALPQGTRYLTESEDVIRMQRLGTILTTKSRSKVTENEAGVVLNFETREESNGVDLISRGFRVGEEIVVLARGLEQRYGVPATALGPRAVDRKSREMPLQAGAEITLSAFMAEYPQKLVTMQGRVLQKDRRTIKGQARELWKLESTISVLPGLKMFLWLDDQAETIVSIIPFPGLGEIELRQATREEALAGKSAPEIFVGTMVKPDRPLKNHTQLKEARLRLSGPQRIELVSGPEQEVVSTTDTATEIVIRVPKYEAKDIGWQLPQAVTPELKPYLQPSPLIEAGEEVIQKLAKQAVGAETNPLKAARKIEAFVRSYITDKDLSVNFASAAETARARQGDCTEHGVLCAALGRAVGLPTRVVIGFGYLPTDYGQKGDSANGDFGFHLWAEAWLGEGKWVAMDAALGQFDVGHIAIFKTALESASPGMELAQPVLSLMEGLKISVLETKPSE